MTTTNDWIKMSERRPTEADLPVWYWSTNRFAPELFTDRLSTDTYYNGSLGYWKPAKADIPAPPKEQTQRERDEAAYRAWHVYTPCPASTLTVWHAALAWERAEIASILGEISPMTWLGNPSYFVPKENMESLHARLRP